MLRLFAALGSICDLFAKLGASAPGNGKSVIGKYYKKCYKTKKSTKGISAADKSYFFRFLGKTHSKFFSDKKCGGRYSSLLSAITWRDKTEKKLGKVRTNKHMVTVSNSGTGVVGVRLNGKLNRYEVSWVTDSGKQGKTSVSITKHGKKEAFNKACQIRKKKESERLGYTA